jgi:GrpB-like predicted nucleotidyltransferase (UPF0157 family)
MRRVTVREWDESYQVEFGEEAMKIREIFGNEVLGVFHIGSTAVPGLKSKPIIDILVVVQDINRVDDFIGGMESIGYTSMGEYGIQGRRYFHKGQEDHTHHVHIFEARNDHIERHIAFRDYLRSHPEVAEKYGNLKLKLADRYPEDIDSYQAGKNSIIGEIQSEAIRWYRQSFRSGNTD